jgi:peptide/nickel transport system permease protein
MGDVDSRPIAQAATLAPDLDTRERADGATAWQARDVARPRRYLTWLLRRPSLLVFGGMIVILVLIAIFAHQLAPDDPTQTHPAQALQSPSREHPLGTDNLGRDTLSRVIYGARISLTAAIIAVSIALIGGLSMGLAAGYLGGWLDAVLSRVVDAQLAFPGILLAIAITSALGPSLRNAMLAVGILGIPAYFRLTRGQVFQAREQEYVVAATLLGASRLRIVARHIFPNIVNPLIVAASIASSGAILALASLSFLGIGTQPPEPDWGSMIQNAAGYLSKYPWLAFGPGVAIFVTVFSFYMFGDALRDALDPHLRNR